jgi:hypothetical protein
MMVKNSLARGATLMLLLSAVAGFAPIQTTTKSHLFQRTAPATTTIGTADSYTTASSTALFGIPKMFRWLTDQYPNINRQINEGLSSKIQVDNLYLDMNGIIHPCTHGNAEGVVIVLDETAMFKKIFLYVDR